MWTLIKREIEDNYIYILLMLLPAVIYTGVFALFLTGSLSNNRRFADTMSVLYILLIIIAFLLFKAFGWAQMYMDLNRKAPAFIITHPTNRGRLFLSKVITGLAAVFIIMTTLNFIFNFIIRSMAFTISTVDYGLNGIYTTLTLAGFAIYAIALNCGLMEGKKRSALISLFVGVLLTTMIFIKGFGPEMQTLTILFTAGFLYSAWNRFKTMPL